MKKKYLLSKMCILCMLFLASFSNYAQNKVVAYVPNWIDLNTFTTKIDYAKLTHINIAFENPVNDAGDLSFNSVNNTLIDKAHDRDRERHGSVCPWGGNADAHHAGDRDQ